MLLSQTALKAARTPVATFLCLQASQKFQRLPALLPPLTARKHHLWNHTACRSATSMTLTTSKIIGDVVDNVQKTGIKLDIKYKSDHVENGVNIKPQAAHSAPSVSFVGAQSGKLYTLLMSDPDPPDPQNPIYREWLHWIVTNIPGATPESSKGQTLTSYMGPAPPIGTHRYAFLLFEQPNQTPLQVKDPSHGESMGRKNFNTRKFAQEHGLGDPVAAAYFVSHK